MSVKVVAKRRSGFTHDVEIEGGHTLVLDEPESAGGSDLAPSPVRALGAALAACTAITVEMYAERKGWDVGDLEVTVDISYEGAAPSSFDVYVALPPALHEEQADKLLVIAAKCPVHKALAHETPVRVHGGAEVA